jgi:membrane-bound metal-dependent hydrolase YbcI (DUF457 family)
MDTITHGIAGALIGKAVFDGDEMFALRPMNRGRIATWSLMLGAIFPDADVFRDMFSRNELLILTWHRSYTHSLLCLPVFAVLLAALTLWIARWRNWDAPSFAMLTAIYATGILSHILLDLVTSFGTMIWSPLQWSRPAWDLIFIIDFTLSAMVLAPQVLAWVYAKREGLQVRALGSWLVFSLAAIGVYVIAQTVEAPFSVRATIAAMVSFAILFLSPGIRFWGLRVKRSVWNFAGLIAALGYIAYRSSADGAVAVALGRAGSCGTRSLRNANRSSWLRRHRRSGGSGRHATARISLLSRRAYEFLYRSRQEASGGADGAVVRALSSHALSQGRQRRDCRDFRPAISSFAARSPGFLYLSSPVRCRGNVVGAGLGERHER